MIAHVVALSVYAFQTNGSAYKIDHGMEIHIQHNKLQIEPLPLGPVEVIDAKGRNVVIRQEGNTVHMKAGGKTPAPTDRAGYVCGPMTVKSGGKEFTFRVRPHHSPVCEEHKH